MAWYSAGTVAVTSGAKTVTGTGTGWFGTLQAGWGLVAPDGRAYEIENVVSDTEMTLRVNYQGATASGQVYTAFPTMSLAADLVARINTLLTGFQGVLDGPAQGRFADGTAEAPGLAFKDDPNTGLFRPGADQLGFSTGGAKRALLSSTAMTFDVKLHAAAGMQVTGSVGIGTAAPGARLHVQSPDQDHLRLAFSAALFTDIYRPTEGGLSIAPQGTERMRIDADGKVGINTTTPGATLEVRQKADGQGIRLTHGGRAGVWDMMHSGVQSEDLIWKQDNGAGSDIMFRIGRSGTHFYKGDGTDAAAINPNSGNFGIGTTTPSSILELSENLGPIVSLRRSGSTDGNGTIRSIGNSGVENARITLGGGVNNHMTFTTNGSERMRIDASGSLLVGAPRLEFRALPAAPIN